MRNSVILSGISIRIQRSVSRRLMESRGYTREKSMSIIASQAPEEFFRAHTDYVVTNNADLEETWQQIREGIKKYETL